MILQPTPNGAMQQLDAAVEAALIENRRHFLRFLTRRLGTVDAAEEVLQQFYLRAVRRSTSESVKVSSRGSTGYSARCWRTIPAVKRHADGRKPSMPSCRP